MSSRTIFSGSLLGQHASVFACPQCRQGLNLAAGSITCSACGNEYVDADGHPDFVPPALGAPSAGHAPLRLQDPVIAARYETHSRPSFFRIMGGNWSGRELTDDDERDYLRSKLSSVTGPAVDVACGGGKWTRVVCDTVGIDQVIGLDISTPLLRQCRAAIPGVTAVRGSALALPFLDAEIGAITIWNALQQMPGPGNVIAEAGRCLRPGGVLILLTYRAERNALARYFQARHEEAFSVSSFSDDQMVAWLNSAGLTSADIGGPANFLMVTARKG